MNSAGPTITSDLPGNRSFVLVSDGLWEHYRRRWREIEQEWVGGWWGCNPAVLSASLDGQRAARDDLRARIRSVAPDYPGTRLIPV